MTDTEINMDIVKNAQLSLTVDHPHALKTDPESLRTFLNIYIINTRIETEYTRRINVPGIFRTS